MIRLSILAVIIFIIYTLLFKKKPKNINKNDMQNNQDGINDMIECKTCKTYITKKDSIKQNGLHFCSNKCLQGHA